MEGFCLLDPRVLKKLCTSLNTLLVLCTISGCSSFNFNSDVILKVQTLDLFDQLYSEDYNELDVNFYSNWIIRRERLSIIDTELSKSKPNIVFFQHMMKKSSTDFDQLILSSNSLSRYNFQNYLTRKVSDWSEYISTATTPRFDVKKSGLYNIGENSFISYKLISFQNDLVALLNVQLKKTSTQDFLTNFKTIYTKILGDVCRHRIILAGFFDDSIQDITSGLESFYFKNPIKPLIDKGESAFASNPLYKLVVKHPKASNYSYDYLFVPRSSNVASSAFVYNKSYPNIFKKSHLKTISASLRSGLEVNVKLRSCR